MYVGVVNVMEGILTLYGQYPSKAIRLFDWELASKINRSWFRGMFVTLTDINYASSRTRRFLFCGMIFWHAKIYRNVIASRSRMRKFKVKNIVGYMCEDAVLK